MESITAWVTAVCGAAIGCSAVLALAPKNGVGKVMRLTVAAVMLLCILRPIGSIVAETGEWWKTPTVKIDNTALGETVQNQLCERVEQAVEELCVARFGDVVEKVESQTDIFENGNIYMKCVRIYVTPSLTEDPSAVKRYVEEQTGLSAEVERWG